MKRKTNTLLIGLGLIMASILISSNYSVESVSAYTASITTNNSIDLDITPTGDGTSIHSESINVQSDCRAGYNLTIATPEGSSLYKYSNNTQADTASFTAVDGTSALSSSNNTNKWGYTLTSNPTSGTVFSPLSSTASILKTPSQTASSEADINDTFSINYGAKVDNTVEAGTYQMANNGAIVYYLTMDTTCTQYTVSFNANGGTGTIADQPMQTGEPARLTSSDSLTAPTTASYTDADNNTITGDPDKLWTFWGWNTEVDGTGDWYKDREAVEDLANIGSTITLYAQWAQPTLADMTTGTASGTEKVIDHNLMQDMSPEVCYNSDKFVAIGTAYGQATLIDNRDGTTRTYTVAKLPDDACWMTQNLNLGASTDITLTAEDTDLASNTSFTLPASNPTDFATSTTQANYNKATVLNNMTIPDYTVNSTTYSGKVNAYYSYAAATADINTYSKSSATIVTTSICPKNWDLPTVAQYYNLRTKGSIANYNNTNTSYIGKNAGNEPYYFIYGGYRKSAGNEIDTTSFYNPLSFGYFWTANNGTYRYGYSTYVSSSGLYNSSSGSTAYKYYGYGIRCVASYGEATIQYDGNGTIEYPVTGSVASQDNVEIASNAIRSGDGFTRDGWVFNSWNTAADGSGESIATGTSLSSLGLKPGETIMLYAQWLPQYAITYVNNCMTYASDSSSCTQSVSDRTGTQKINLDANGDGSGTLGSYNYNSWTLNGWKIKGWSTVADNSSGANAEYPVSSTYSVVGQGAGVSITLYAHWVPVYSIQYDGNNADNPNGMGTTDNATGVKSVKQTNVGEGDSVVLLASNFKKSQNGFAGWSTDPDAWTHFTDNDNTNDPIIYGPMETISAPAYPNNGTSIITMYAVWVPVEKDGSNNPVYLQDFGKDQCDNLTSAVYNSALDKITAGSVMALTDKRDNEVYTIAKLADGKCWMIENLRLDAAGTLGTANELLSQGYGGVAGTYGSFVGLADSESTGFSATASSNTVYEASANPPINTYDPANGVLEDIGSSDEPARRFPRYNNSNNSSALSAPSFTENYLNALNPSATGIYKTSTVSSYGNYYTWSAAIANTGKSPSEAAETSICPSGWHLPSSVTTKEFGKLSQQYGGSGSDQSGVGAGDVLSSRFRSFPNNYIYSGYISGSSVSGRGSYGYYWSRSANNNWQYDSAQILMLGSTRIDPSNTSKMYYGFSIRCIVDYEYTIQYDGNGADNPNGMGIVVDIKGKKSVKQRGITEGINVMLLPSNYKRAGYGFVGWSTDSDAWSHFTDNDSTNDPVIYGPAETIVTPAYPANGIMTMYAVWVPAKKDGNNEPVYLQDFGVSECNNLTSAVFDSTSGATIVNKNSIVVLTDKRDNELYAVARLVDGKCWMIENLRLEHDGTMGNNINDSSVTNESLSQGYGGTAGVYGTFVGLAESEDNLSSSTTSNTVYKSSVDPPVDTYDPINNVLEDIGTGGYSGPGYRFPRYNNTNTHDIIDSPTYSEDYAYNSSPRLNKSGTYGDASIYSYGNYYTWSAAMANTNDYNSSVSENANTSICPTNWHLPSSGSWSKEYGVLAQGYGGATNDTEKRLMAFPNNFIYAGDIPGSSIMRRGSSGSYWSRSADNSGRQFTYSLDFGNTSFGINYVTMKYWGISVRCLVGS